MLIQFEVGARLFSTGSLLLDAQEVVLTLTSVVYE